jgi:hypothetical protein
MLGCDPSLLANICAQPVPCQGPIRNRGLFFAAVVMGGCVDPRACQLAINSSEQYQRRRLPLAHAPAEVPVAVARPRKPRRCLRPIALGLCQEQDDDLLPPVLLIGV